MQNKLTQLFDEKNPNLSEMARELDIPYGSLYNAAKGITPLGSVKVDYVIKIAEAFGMTADELIDNQNFDTMRYELFQTYNDLSATERVALLACARGLIGALPDGE